MRVAGFVSVVLMGCAPAAEEGAGAPRPPEERDAEGVEVRFQAVVVGDTECPAHVVAVRPGVDLLVDWSGVTMDILGDPIEGDLREGSFNMRSYVGVETDEVLAACGMVDREQLGQQLPLWVDEPAAVRTVPGYELPDLGGVASIDVISHGQFVFRAFILPDAAVTTTTLVVQ
jgi:hypothetical protein